MTKPNILVVDDKRLTRNSLSRNLTIKGYEAIKAESGSAALEVLARQPIHLVSTDCQMPGMDGWDLILNINECYPNVPIIGHGTGFYSDGSRSQQYLSEGRVKEFYNKLRTEEMLRCVEKYCLKPK